MKALIIKDKKKRNFIKKRELKYLYYKTLLHEKRIINNNSISWKLYKLKFNSSQIKNYCLLTNNSKTIFRKFKISRIQLKQQIWKNNLLGLKQSNW